jgi:tol-pal system protein YbgF
MKYRLLLIGFAASLLPFCAWSIAAVVDDSENFALLEEQHGAYAPPVARDEQGSMESMRALAHDDSQNDENATLLNKIQGLQQDIQELRGQLDVQAHDLKQLQEQQLSLYRDLDARLSQKSPIVSTNAAPIAPSSNIKSNNQSLAARTLVTPAVIPVTQQHNTDPADEQLSYLAAYELVKSKNFSEAQTAMQAFLDKYPHGGYSANAQYWLGELYLAQQDYTKAMTHFRVVLKDFPSSSKRAASLLKIGFAQATSGKSSDARITLQKVIKAYPDTDTARLARDKLQTLQ